MSEFNLRKYLGMSIGDSIVSITMSKGSFLRIEEEFDQLTTALADAREKIKYFRDDNTMLEAQRDEARAELEKARGEVERLRKIAGGVRQAGDYLMSIAEPPPEPSQLQGGEG